MNKKNDSRMRVYVFIDASNLWEAQKSKAKLINYASLSDWLKVRYKPSIFQIFFYTAYPKNGTRSYSLSSRHKFYTYLKKGLNFVVRKKELKRIYHGRMIIEKGNMDVEMTIDVMRFIESFDIAILFSGDSDFLELVSHVRQKGKLVYIYSSKNNVSTELRTGADGYTDILTIEEICGNDLVSKNERAQQKATLNKKSGSGM